VLLVVTSVLATVLTELFAPGMVKEEARAKARRLEGASFEQGRGLRV